MASSETQAFLRIVSPERDSVRDRVSVARGIGILFVLMLLMSQGGPSAYPEQPMKQKLVTLGALALATTHSNIAMADSRYEAAIVASGPTSYWRFEDSDAAAANTIAQGPVGTISGTVSTGEQSAAPALGRCLRFQAGGVMIPFSPLIEPTEEFAVELWMNADPAGPTFGFALSMGRDIAIGSLKFVMRPTLPDCTLICGKNDYVRGSWPVPAGSTTSAWHHYVFTWSRAANRATMFVDGVVVSDLPFATTFTTNQQPLFIGRHGLPTFPYYFVGSIDEVAIYQRSLSETEVLQHYCASGIDPSTCCQGDVNDDGDVNGSDVAVILGFWGTGGTLFPAADVNRDGTVNGADLAGVLSNWGPCPH
jgi:hypothetical protein